jgi:hypothetical protein
VTSSIESARFISGRNRPRWTASTEKPPQQIRCGRAPAATAAGDILGPDRESHVATIYRAPAGWMQSPWSCRGAGLSEFSVPLFPNTQHRRVRHALRRPAASPAGGHGHSDSECSASCQKKIDRIQNESRRLALQRREHARQRRLRVDVDAGVRVHRDEVATALELRQHVVDNVLMNRQVASDL